MNQKEKVRGRKYVNIYKFEDENYNNICDGLFGTVIDNCGSGVFLELENGEPAFASFGRLRPGQRVFCTVLKKANGHFRTLVSIDSTLCDQVAA